MSGDNPRGLTGRNTTSVNNSVYSGLVVENVAKVRGKELDETRKLEGLGWRLWCLTTSRCA